MAGRDGPEAMARPARLVARVEPVDAPIEAGLRAFTGPSMAWLAPDEPAVIGAGETATLEADGPGRFETIRREADTLFESLAVESPADAPAAARPRLLGGFAFHDEPESGSPWAGFPGAAFVLPRVQLTRSEGGTWLAVTGRADEAEADPLRTAVESARNQLAERSASSSPPPGVTDVRRNPDRAGWREQIEAAVDRIAAGELEKVVLAQTLSVRLRGPFRLADTVERLGDAYPDCYRFAVDPGLGSAFFGATPERLVRRGGDRVETDAIAGSIGRGGTEAEDRRLARALEASEKVRHEHAVVVEAIREQLASVAEDVRVGDRTVRKLSNVQHLDAPVTGRLREPAHVLDLVEALHPTPAVGGRPPDAAERLIAATEQFDRGWYAAPVGWFDANGDGTFAVGIRSAVATPDRATLFAGNGIVADSDPDEEWGELQLKYRPILDQLR
jgi:menaquinone-specific isochorismate synthase